MYNRIKIGLFNLLSFRKYFFTFIYLLKFIYRFCKNIYIALATLHQKKAVYVYIQFVVNNTVVGGGNSQVSFMTLKMQKFKKYDLFSSLNVPSSNRRQQN